MSYFIAQPALELLMRAYFSKPNSHNTKTKNLTDAPTEPTEKNRNPYWQNQKFNLKKCLENHGYEPILFQINLSQYSIADISFEGLSMHRVRIHHQDAHPEHIGHPGFFCRKTHSVNLAKTF